MQRACRQLRPAVIAHVLAPKGVQRILGKGRDDEVLQVTLTTGSGSYTVKKPPHPESESNDTINQVKTLMWEGLLTIESDNGCPAAEYCAIEEGAFDGCGNVNVYSAADSPAAEYCRTHTNCTLIAQ